MATSYHIAFRNVPGKRIMVTCNNVKFDLSSVSITPVQLVQVAQTQPLALIVTIEDLSHPPSLAKTYTIAFDDKSGRLSNFSETGSSGNAISIATASNHSGLKADMVLELAVMTSDSLIIVGTVEI